LAAALLADAAVAFEGFSPAGEGPAYPDAADGRKTAKPTIQAHRLNGTDIRLDGRLDDSAWQAAPAARGFKIWDPDRGMPAAEETVFKVAYDEGAVYFAVACFEKDASKIAAALSRRDAFSNSDVVAIYVDPYHDHTTGYAFKVNPLGVQLDSYVYNDGEVDEDWNAVWEAETSRDANGWYAEIRIPFSAIRYRSGDVMTWGLNVWRYMHSRGQDTAWQTWPREQNGFVSQFAELAGLAGVRAPRQIELLPYVVQRGTDYSMVGDGDDVDGFQNLGADLKYGITSDLTLNATIQPDFGQVEADPAVLNLSPFETFYDEKRPFFIEGSRFFQHPTFNMFYSRRVGTGDENARIRYAGKLTGKIVGGISVAALAASTDLTGEGQAHNLFKNGKRLSRFFVGRFGKEFSQGRHRVNMMQTVVLNTGSRFDGSRDADFQSREAYTTGLDFELASPKRTYSAYGSFVGSVIDPEPLPSDPLLSDKPVYGTGGEFGLRRLGGKWRSTLNGRWESGKLDINDIGFLSSPDEIGTNYWLQRNFNPDGKSKVYNRANLNLNLWRSWIYAGRTGLDVNTGLPAWSYGKGHPQYNGGNVNGWMQFRNYRELWGGVSINGTGIHRFETRGGPLIREPFTYTGWWGFITDTRKDFRFRHEGQWSKDTANNLSVDADVALLWKQSSAVNHELALSFNSRSDDTQYLETVNVAARPGGVGIGGLAYVYGDIDQKTADLTLRSNFLFSRNQSLEVYAQPFITVGDYDRVRELKAADTYEFRRYNEPGYDARNFDFTFASMNVNMVYRWEYRPGSTFFLVWKQSRSKSDDRWNHLSNPNGFDNSLGTDPLFSNEPENTLLAKITYWLPI
jgi:hypothetical protein